MLENGKKSADVCAFFTLMVWGVCWRHSKSLSLLSGIHLIHWMRRLADGDAESDPFLEGDFPSARSLLGRKWLKSVE